VIQDGTTPRQRIVVAPLGEIAARVREAGLEPPVVIIAGEVVRLRDRLDWFSADSFPDIIEFKAV